MSGRYIQEEISCPSNSPLGLHLGVGPRASLVPHCQSLAMQNHLPLSTGHSTFDEAQGRQKMKGSGSYWTELGLGHAAK